MNIKRDSFLDRLNQNRSLKRWSKAAELAERTPLGRLRKLREDAQQLRREIERVLHIADARLTLPLIGSDAIRRPLGSDWAWRPELWRGPVVPIGHAGLESRSKLGAEVTVFHDCAKSELTVRQVRNQRETDLAPFGLRMDVFRFDGSFLSIVIDLPAEALQGLRLTHLIRLDCLVEVEKPLEIFARLNVQHGPNSEQLVRELQMRQSDVWVEFDLAYTRMNEKRVEKAWIDLIFEGPEMNQITLRDLTFSRRPRAEL
jgi:hypothetical protein